MEEFYIAFKEKCVIHAEAQFDAESFKTACPDIYYHIETCDWGPFTIPVDPYLPELVRGQEVPVTTEVINSIYLEKTIPSHPKFHNKLEDKENQLQWVANLIAKGRPQWDTSEGLIHWRDLKFKARMWLNLVCSRLIPSRNTSEVPIEVSILLACIMDQAACPLFRPLDRTVQANNLITLATKINKEAPSMKREKAEFHNYPPPDFFNIAPRAKMHENQLVQLAKPLLSMIWSAIKRALPRAKDKFSILCSIVDVLESEVDTLKKEVVALTAPPSTSQPNPCEPEAVPEAPRIPLDDWWVSYESDLELVSDEEHYHSRPPPPPMR
ncbi:hypothetical protein HAX54_030555 [Datura stramonium]|uniref:Putative plant transposon protein domain-containing protein n=1 Tax=Datura stramonium TaxID=4076 RepID=A0ABS8V9Y5_DATST|nr:hypothetical protein [Datura stramonium]